MDNLFTILLIVVFIVAPLLERALRGSRKPPPPPLPRSPQTRTQLPTGRPSAQRSAPRSQTQTDDATDATELIPADLWEILTGQRRPEPAPPPRAPRPFEPAPEEAETIEVRRAETRASDEESALDDLLRRRERSTEVVRRVEYAPPTIVSLETEPLPEPRRHEAFHRKLDARASAATVRMPRQPTLLGIDPRNRSELQRAVMLLEVLGRPRALEE